jgi:dehydrogenase/reductase SDR family protein 7B
MTTMFSSLLLVHLLLLLGSLPSSSFQLSVNCLERSSNSARLATTSKSKFHCSFGKSSSTPTPSIQHRPQSRTLVGMGASSSNSISNLNESTKSEYHQKSILLTGASRGLGKSLAHALSTCQPSLLILSGRDEKALKEVQQECLQIASSKQQSQRGSRSFSTDDSSTSTMRVEIVVCDLAERHSVEQLATISLQLAKQHSTGNSSSSRSGGNNIDILINNGGISSRSSFLTTDLTVDEKLMQVNFFSGVALAKKLVPGMVARGAGKVIWISSVQGKLGTPYRTSYAASKFAVQGYCESLRSELASSNVSVHVVSPGYIRTNLSLSAVMGDGSAYSKMDETTANGRWCCMLGS